MGLRILEDKDEGIPLIEKSVAVANALAALGMEEYWLGKLRATYRRRRAPRVVSSVPSQRHRLGVTAAQGSNRREPGREAT